MAKLLRPIDLDAEKAVLLAPSDSDAAARALLYAAKYIRENKPLPFVLAQYLSDAIIHSMQKDKEHRNAQFLRELHLQAENRRPVAALWLEDGMEMADLIEQLNYSQNDAAEELAKKTGISISAAKRLYKKFVAIRDNPKNAGLGHWEWQEDI